MNFYFSKDGDYSISRKKSEPHSPTPSVDRLSVTFALDDEPEEDKDSVNTEFTEQPNRIGNISNSTKKTTDNENKKFIESYKTAANNQVIIEPKNLPVTVDPRGKKFVKMKLNSNVVKHRRCLSFKVILVLRKSLPSSELILCGCPQTFLSRRHPLEPGVAVGAQACPVWIT